jgi:microcin C transport system permease protein
MSLPAVSPSRRAWLRFKHHKLGYYSLMIFCVCVVLSLVAELLSNDKPLVARYNGQWLFPMIESVPETAVGGDFQTNADFLDPFVKEQFAKDGNFALMPINPYHHSTLNYYAKAPNPAPPSWNNWLGTDDRGRDVAARLLYGFRVSVLFALALTAIGVVLGMITGAILQGARIWSFSVSSRFGARCRSCIC